MKRNALLTALYLILSVLLAACDLIANPPLPTVSSIESAQTAVVLTQNAPPVGFRDGVKFAHVDDNLSQQPGWHYTVSLRFDGTFAGSSDPATGEIAAEVFSSELAGERRVLLKASGSAFGLTEARNVEGVRISNSYYLVDQNKVCLKIAQPKGDQVADLAAGALIGGVKQAAPAGVRRTDTHGDAKIDLWEYTFVPDAVNPPTLQLGDGGGFSVAAGDLWIVPAYNAVGSYTMTLDVKNATLQGGARAVTGKLRASYQLVDAGKAYSVSIPFGC